MAEHSTNDSISRAIDLIVKERVSNLKFDQTIICTITDDSDKDAGHYTVNDGAISFDAYCENTEYKTNDSVYVTIPSGDFTQTKVIISKYTANQDEDPMVFKSPLDEMFIISGNLAEQKHIDESSNGIVANGRTELHLGENYAPGQTHLIWEYDLANDSNASLRNNQMFDRLGIQVSFKCDLGATFNMSTGHYGIIIELFSTPVVDNENAESIQQTLLLLDTEDVFGNPYTFMTYMPQSKVFNIAQVGNITKMNVYLFQSGDFTYTRENNVGDIETLSVPNSCLFNTSGTNQEEVEIGPNIFAANLEVYFGVDLSGMEDNTFMLYSASPSMYSMVEVQENPDYNKKAIIPIWFNKNEDNTYIGFSDGIYSRKIFKDAYNSSIDLVGRNYDENEYVRQARYINKGATLNQEDLTKNNIPPIQELMQIYAYLREGEKILKNKIAPIFATKIDRIINQAVSDFATQQTAAQQNTTNVARTSFFSHQDYATIKSNIELWIDENNSQSWMGLGMATLKHYGNFYTGATSTVPNAATEFQYLYNIWATLSSNVSTMFNYGFTFFSATENSLNESSKVYWTTYNDKWQALSDECNQYVSEFENILYSLNGDPYNGAADLQRSDRDSMAYQYYAITTRFSNITNDIIPSDMNYSVAKENFTNSFANRYCIYWYRFSPGYKNEDENFIQANWEPIKDTMNYGLPLDNEYTEDPETGDKYWIARSTGINSTVYIDVGREDTVEEKIRAVLIYNHQIYRSNILTYTNKEPAIDNSLEDKVGLWIATTDREVSTTEFDDNGEAIVLQEDTYNNKETYQLYGDTGYLVNQSEAFKTRKIRARFSGSKNKGDSYLIGSMIYWYLPVHASMLTVKHEDLTAYGFDSIVDTERNYEELYSAYREELKVDESEGSYKTQILNLVNEGYLTIPSDFNVNQTQFSSNEEREEWNRAAGELILKGKKAKLDQEYSQGYYNVPPSGAIKNNYQDGYLMASRKIVADANNPDLVDVKSTEFFYQIKDYYIPSFTNNTIKCKVVKDGLYIYEAEVSFTFSSFGTNGTDYSLCIVPADNQYALRDDKNLHLKVAVYDVNGDLMEKETNSVEVSWDKNIGNCAWLTNTTPDIVVTRVGSGQFGYSVLKATVDVVITSYKESISTDTTDEFAKVSKQTEDEMEQNGEQVDTSVKVKESRLEEGKTRTVTLTAYYPIAWAAEDYYIEGPTTVVYDSGGANPKYYNGPYRIFNGLSFGENAHKELSNISVEVSAPYFDGSNPDNTQSNAKYTTLQREMLPKIKVSNVSEGGGVKYELSVPSMFVSGNDAFVNVIIKSGGNIIFIQPIRVFQNRFSSPMLNAWDGELTIDEKNGTILASMVGAGKKERDNTFSGVLMGDVAEKTEDSGTGIGKQGLFGFNHGEQAFGFLNDGTGFIGKAKRGRIMFDGNSSQIQSMSYATNKLGMRLDLDDGEIDMRGGYVDYNQQSDVWRDAAKIVKRDEDGNILTDANGNIIYEDIPSQGYEGADGIENSSLYAIPEENQGMLNNNEVNGYDNQTHYSEAGSRVTISTRSPFLRIVSPSKTYSTETKFQNTLDNFWKGIEYYGTYLTDEEKKSKSASELASYEENNLKTVVDYLHNYFDLYNPEFYLYHTATITDNKSNNNLSGTLDNAYPYYVRISKDIDYAHVSDYLKNKLSGNYDINEANYVRTNQISGAASPETENCYALYQNDYIYVDETGKYSYVPKSELPQANLLLNKSDFASKKFLVKKDGSKVSSIKFAVQGGTQKTLTEIFGNVAEYTVEVLAQKILDSPTEFSTNGNSLDSQNYMSNLRFLFLQSTDYTTGETLLQNSNSGGNKNPVELMYVGTNKYFLQTDNYHKGTAANNYRDGKGLKFDLYNGSLEAYKFGFMAVNVADGSFIKFNSNGNPFFQVAYGGSNRNPSQEGIINLMEISNSNFILQSQNWYNKAKDDDQNAYNSGTQIDLRKGKITSYDFHLKALEPKTDNPYFGGFIEFSSSGNPYLKVHQIYIQQKKDKNNQNLGDPIKYENDTLKITRDQFVMRSANFHKNTGNEDNIPTQGVEFNLTNGKITAYSFNLKAINEIKWKTSDEVDDPITEGEVNNTVSNILSRINSINNEGFIWGSDQNNGLSLGSNDLDAFEKIKKQQARYNGSYVEINNSGNPYLCVRFKDIGRVAKVYRSFQDNNGQEKWDWSNIPYPMESDKALLLISNNQFVIESPGYADFGLASTQAGLKIDLINGTFAANNAKFVFKNQIIHNFNINESGPTTDNNNLINNEQNDPSEGEEDSENNSGSRNVVRALTKGTCTIDGTKRDWVIEVHSTSENYNNRYFRVYWDGSIYASAGTIGGWRINNTSLWTNGTDSNGKPGDKSFRLCAKDFARKIGPFAQTLSDWDSNEDYSFMSETEKTNICKALKELRIAIGHNLGITSKGVLIAKDGIFYGKIVSKSGNIGGWLIEKNVLRGKNANGETDVYLCSDPTTNPSYKYNIYGASINGAELTGGSISIGPNGYFTVTSDGKCTATWINAIGGNIGGCSIVNNGLSGGTIDGATITGGTIKGAQIWLGEVQLTTDTVDLSYISDHPYVIAPAAASTRLSGSCGGCSGSVTIDGTPHQVSVSGGTCYVTTGGTASPTKHTVTVISYT